MSQTDEHLVAAFRGGDRTVLEELLRRHASPLLGFLVRMLGNRTDAEDVFQETFQRVLMKLSDFDTSRRFKPWLYAIAHNAAVDSLRKRKRRPERISLDGVREDAPGLEHLTTDHAPTPAESADLADRKARVRAAIEVLPNRQRAALVLVYYHDMTYADAAEAMGCSLGTVKTHMSRALRSLAHHLPEPLPQLTGGGP